jgi:hypothetical protein
VVRCQYTTGFEDDAYQSFQNPVEMEICHQGARACQRAKIDHSTFVHEAVTLGFSRKL